MNPLVSVVLSVHNGEAYLSQATESILEQTFRDFEFIIIDDGSRDESLDIIRSYARQDSRIMIIENGVNIGLSRSLNKGIAFARGIYIARMDADDISLPDRFQKQCDYLDRHPEIGVVGGQARKIDDENRIIGEVNLQVLPALVKWDLLFGSALVHPAVMMRKELVASVGGYSTEMVYAQDYDLWRRLADITQLTNLPDFVLYLRLHPRDKSPDYLKRQSDFARTTQELILSQYFDINRCQYLVELLHTLKPPEQQLEKKVMLLITLYRAFQENNTLSVSERFAIRRNLGFRIFNLVKSSRFSWFKTRILFQSICFAPAVMKSVTRLALHSR